MTSTQTAPAAASAVRNVVFIDSSVTDLQFLMTAMRPGTQVELINVLDDGVDQIAAILRQYSGLDSIQIVSHGSEGQLRLGSAILSGDSLAEYQAQLQDWGRALSEDGDLLLYGCDVAAGDTGQAFIDALAQTTGADVAASTDTTGSSLRSANWTLERSTGSIEAASALSAEAQQAYAHTLALVNNGSAGTITFNTSSDVTLLNATGLAPGAVVHADNILSTGLDVYAQSTAGGSITVTNANGTSVLGVPLTDDRLTVNGSLLSPVSHVDLRANSGVFDLLSLKLGSGNLVGNLLGTTVFTVYALDANYQPTGVGVSLTGLVVNEYGLLNFASMANFKGIFGIRIVNPLGFEVGIDDIQVANGKAAPSITSASYNAGSGVLSITAAGISAGDTIDPTKLSLSGEGGSYTLTSPSVTASSGSSIVITLNAADKLALNGVLNNNGGTAVGGATFNLAAALNWDSSRPSGQDLAGNPVTVSNVQLPTISSATYDATTHVLTVTGSNLVALVGASNDITVSKLTLRGDGGASHTLATTGNVEVTSASAFSVTLSGADIAAVAALLNKNGAASAGGSAYALSAGDDWNGVIGNTSIAVGGVGVVVSNVGNSAPTITGTATASIGDNATVQPFANVTVADVDGGSLSLTISYNAANGSLSGAGLTGSAGSYSLSAATPAALTAQLKALTFTPTANQAVVGAQVNTSFSLTATDSQGLSSPAHTATVTATSINDASVIGGTVAAQPVAAGGTVRPFSGVTISDPDVGTSVTVTIGISQSGGTHGIFTPASASAAGFVSNDGGLTYTLGPAAPGAAQAALQSLVFQAVAGQGGTTTFSLSVSDGSATVSNTTTSVVATVPSSTTALTVAFSSDTGISATDLITQTAAQTLSGTLSGGLASGETVQVSLDNGASWTQATAQVGSSHWTLAGQTLTGAGILQVRVTNAGGSSTPLSASYALDTTPPGTLGQSVQFSNDTGASNADLITRVAQQDISGMLNAVLAGDEHVEVSLDNGATWVTASSSSGSAAWSLAGQTLAGSNTLQVRVVDAAGNAGGTFSAAYALDTTAPTVALSSNVNTLQSGETALITLAFSEAPYGLSLSDLSAVGGTLAHLTATADPRVFTVEFSPNAGQSGVLGSVSLAANSYTDIVGNDGAGGSTGPITIGTLGPSLQISSDMAALRIGQTAQITFTFSSPPTGFLESDIVVTGGTLGGFASQGAGIYTAVFTPGANVSEAASITVASGSYTDAFGNPGGAGVTPLLQVDTVAPTLLITSDVPALKTGETATITFTFSEAPSGFTDADVVVGNGTLGPLSATSDPRVYTAVFTPQANLASGAASITVAPGSYADPAGNGGGAGASPTIAIHTQGPSTTGADVAFSADTGTSGSDLVTRTAAQDISGTLTTALASGETVQVSLDNGANWNTASAAEGSNGWSLAGRTLTQSDTLLVRVQDAAGNYGPVFSANYVLDTSAPSVQVVSDLSSLRAGETATLTVTFSEAPAQFGANSFDVTGGTIGNVTVTADPLIYTAIFTPTPGQNGATATFQVKAGGYSDQAGNDGLASASTSISVHTEQPALAITSDASMLGIGATTRLTFTFSSAPTGFTASDISASNGTLSDFAATNDPLVYTAQFTPTPGLASAQATVAVASGAYTDAFGNSGVGAASLPIGVDTLAPSVLITSSTATLKAGETAVITFSFSEIPQGFNAGSVNSNGGTLSGLAVTADPQVFTALFTPSPGIQNIAAGFSFAPGAVTDAAGNALTTPTVAPLVIDTLAPVSQASTVVFSNDDGTSTTDLVTRMSAQDISGTLTSPLGADEHVEVSLNNGSSWDVATASGTAWSLPGQILAGSNTLQVRVTDAAGNHGPVHSAAYVLDTTAPSVAITSSTGPLKAGDTATVTFTFSEAVAGFSLSGVAAGSGTLSDLVQTGNPLVYTALYTPNPGVDGVQDSISVTAGSYTDRAGNAGSGGLSGGITVDTVAPTTMGLTVVFSGDSNLPDRVTNVAAQTISGTLSATPQAGEVVQVSLDQGNTWASATSTGPNSWSLPGQILSPGAGRQVQVRVSDAAGNHGAVASFGYTLDQSPPSVQITSEKASLNSADTPVITFRFSEVPVDFSAASLDVTGGLLSGLAATADPLVYQAVFTPTPGQPSGTGTVTVLPGTYTDLAGNSGLGAPALSMPYNTVSPGVSIHSDLAVLKAGDVATITFQFSTAPQGFAPQDLVVSGGTLSGLMGTADALVYTAQFTPTAGLAQGTAQISIASGLFTDINGNPGLGGSLPPVRIDTLAPELAITSDTDQLNASGTALITFTFSEEPATFGLGSISATNGTLSGLVQTGNPLVYTAVFTPTAQLSGASAQISVAQNAYADLAGNGGGASAGPVIHIQTQGPQLTSSGVRLSDDTGLSDTDLITRTAQQDITGTLAGGVLAAGDVVQVSWDNGQNWVDASSATGSASWILAGQNLADHSLNGSGSLKVRVVDGAGNTGQVATHAFVLDTTAPTVTISSDATRLRAGESTMIRLSFSEAPQDFTAQDLAVTGGTLSGFTATADPLVYNVLLTPTPGTSGQARVTLANGLYSDTAGNDGGGASSPDIAIDTQVPALAITSNAAALRAGQSATVTFSFDKPPVGFTLGSVTATDGTLSDFAASTDPLVFTATFTPTPGLASGSAQVSVAPGAYTDGAGNPGTGAISTPMAIDTLAPTTTGASVSFSADHGISAMDLLTNVAQQTVSGTVDAPLQAGEHVEVSLDNGATWTPAQSTGPVQWQLDLQLLDNGAPLQVRVADTAGNTGPVFSVSYGLDRVAPTVHITSSATSLRAGESATLTFTFSEVPSGFDDSALTATHGTLSGFTSTADPRVYTVVLTPLPGQAGSSASVSVAPGLYTDAAGNPGAAAASPPILLDTALPVLQITSDASVLRLGQQATIEFRFSKLPLGFGMEDITVTGAVLSGFGQTADPLVYTAILTPTPGVANGSATIDVSGGYTDSAGNPGGVSAMAPIAYSTLGPSTGAASVSFSTDTGASGTDLITSHAQQLISGTLDASLMPGETVQISLDNGQTWLAATSVAGQDTWAMPAELQLSGSGMLQVRVAGISGNPGPVWWTNYAIDTTATTVTLTSDVAAIKAGDSATVTFTFSEPPQGFTTAGLTVTGGSIGALVATSDPHVYTVVFTPAPGYEGPAGVTLAPGSYTDAAGNAGLGGTLAGLTVDNTPPVLNPSGSSPADDATGVGTGVTLVLSFGDPLGSLDPGRIYLRDVATQTQVAAQVSIDASGRLVIQPGTPLQGNTAYYVSWDAGAIRDLAGNAAAPVQDMDSFNFTTGAGATTPTDPTTPTEPTQPTDPTVPTNPTEPTEPTNPTNPTQPTDTIDGVQVVTRPGDGGTTITDIPIVTAARNEDPNTPHAALADIPIVRGAGGQAILEVGVPMGMGLQAQGVLAGLSGNAALDELLLRMDRAGGNADQLALGRMFEGTLDPSMPLYIQTLTLRTGPGYDPQLPFMVRGSNLAGTGELAVVLDARALPPGSVIQVDQVPFVAVMGSVRLIGGQGQYFVTADNEDQWIVVGTGDDILHGGGGNDTVGSLGGNDQVFGDAGDDIVFGGSGNDTLSGGPGNDRLDGGLGWDTALQSGALADYTLAIDGEFLVLTHRTTGEIDRLKSVERVQFDSGASLYIADTDAEAALAHIVTRWLGREMTADEGVWAQNLAGMTDLQVAEILLGSPYRAQLQGHTAQELIAGWRTNPQIVRMETTPERVQGTAGHDEIRYDLRWADANLQYTGEGRWEGTSLIDGDMAEFLGIERLHLRDTSVALDMQGKGGKVAALLAVTLGAQMLQNRDLAGEGLAALDAGMGVQAVGEAAMRLVQAQQGHAFTAQETVQWLWTHATGSAGTPQQLQSYVQQLQSGQLSTGDLVNAAVQHALANPSAQLVGTLEGGLLYNA